MASHSSAGVYTKEDDRSLRAQATSPSIAVIVGESHKGPVMERTLVTDVGEFNSMFGQADAAVSYMHYCAKAFLAEGSRLYVTRVAPTALYGGLRVYRSNNLCFAEAWPEGVDDPDLREFQSEDLFTISAIDPGVWNDTLHVVIYPNTNQDDGTFYIDVYVTGKGQPVESHLVQLAYGVDGYGVQRNVADYINHRSSYIYISQNFDNAEYLANPDQTLVNTLCTAGVHGGQDSRKATAGEIIHGWELYADPEDIDISILINGGYTTPSIQLYMKELAEERMDCIAVLDTPSLEQDVSDAVAWRRNTLNLDTSYAALYAPDVYVLDENKDINLFVPPSGYVAAAYARTDNEFETWFAPAGMNRGNVPCLGVRHVYNLGKRDALTDAQINPIRVIPGGGIKIWGAETLQSMPSALSNVNVRRLMIYLEKALSAAATYGVFDPNDAILRQSLTEMCERFLQGIKDGRGLYAYQVICDDTNNKPETIAAGDLHLDLYLDPVIPAKRIYLTAVVTKTGAKLQAVALQGSL